MSFLGAAGWTIGLQLFLGIAAELTEAARPGALGDLVTVTTLYVLAYSIVLFVIFRIYEPMTPLRSVLAVRPFSIPGALLSVISSVAIFPVISLIDDVITKHRPDSAEETEMLDHLFRTDTTAQRIVVVASRVLIIPICHELFFRGVIYGGLRRGRVASLAIFGAAVFFAGASFDVRAFPTMIVLGVLLTWIRSRSGSLLPSLLANVAFWVVGEPVFFKHATSSYSFSLKWALGGAALSALAALGATAIFTRDERALTARILDA